MEHAEPERADVGTSRPAGGPATESQDANVPASAGGTGAPPDPAAANTAPPVTREYRTDHIAVQWYADRCIHTGRCIRAAPAVFDPTRRPWVDVSAAPPDEVAAAVILCPTGALHYTRPDGGPPEPVPDEATVTVSRHGPLIVRGDVAITREDGSVIRRDTRVALCRCGQSAHMPFCDNSHRATGFRG